MDVETANRKFQKELNAGAGALVILGLLQRTSRAMYGYEIGKHLEELCEKSLPMHQGALYPALRSLEKSGLLASEVEPSVSGPPRRYYRITELGQRAFVDWLAAWKRTKTSWTPLWSILVETTIHLPHPAIQRYLQALEASLREVPGVAPEEGLADAQEFLQSELTSIRHRQPSHSDDELYQHFIERFGAPAEVAAGYAEGAEIAATGGALTVHLPEFASPPRGSRYWLLAAFITQSAVLVGGIACFIIWRIIALDTSNSAVAMDLPEQEMAPAGRVVSAQRGESQRVVSIDPQAALGLPDCQNSSKQPDKYFAIGYGGELTIEFINRLLVDGPGADLAIFEVGFPAEPVDVAVSENGQEWFPIGRTGREAQTLDLADYSLSGKKFRFVRIVDAKTKITSNREFWGADIDAVVAIHTARPR